MTLIRNKYSYAKLSRTSENGKRKYLAPDGSLLASVTTILDSTKDKTALIEWRNRVGEKQATQITTEAANVGTRMHRYLEEYVENGQWSTPGSNHISKLAHQMAAVIGDHALVDVNEIWGSEISLYFPGIYAGTTDLVGLYRNNPAILDFKQTNRPKKSEWVDDYRLQIVAYAMAHNEVYGTNIREGHVFMCSRSLEYQQFDVWPDEFDHWCQIWWKRCEQYYLNQQLVNTQYQSGE